MKTKKHWLLVLLFSVIIAISGAYLSSVNIPVLEPKGVIADKEFRLLITVVLIMCIVVVPVFILLAYFIYKYRDDNPSKKRYSPDWDGNHLIEGIWWLIPSVIIGVLSVITWNATYALNPYRPIKSINPPIVVQVIALDWKWLFIYPAQHLASVNQLNIPLNTPVHFYLTSDAPMNSFWIPQLSGQIYCMPGMRTQLYLEANQAGTYKGWSANISGIGFAGMMFNTTATSRSGFNRWVAKIQADHNLPNLSFGAYNRLAKPTLYVPARYYRQPATDLFQAIIDKYMLPGFSYGRSLTPVSSPATGKGVV